MVLTTVHPELITLLWIFFPLQKQNSRRFGAEEYHLIVERISRPLLVQQYFETHHLIYAPDPSASCRWKTQKHQG